jgi:branched-subunit amino acid aminotransferase/4-amino-4-deoxychorismate lyase
MWDEYIWWRGQIVMPAEVEIPFRELLVAHYVYQRVQFHDGVVPHLTEHLAIVERTFWSIYRTRVELDPAIITHAIATLARRNRYQTEGAGLVVLLCFFPAGEGVEMLATCERPLIEVGYTVSSLRPVAVIDEYKLPYEGFAVSFGLAAERFYEELAARKGATKSVRAQGEELLECGTAPLFGIRGRTLFTAPLTAGVVDSVERGLVVRAAERARIEWREEPVLRSELATFDELFYATAAGITSLSECHGTKFMSLLVNRIIDQINEE